MSLRNGRKSNVECRMSNIECRISSIECRMPNIAQHFFQLLFLTEGESHVIATEATEATKATKDTIRNLRYFQVEYREYYVRKGILYLSGPWGTERHNTRVP